VELACLREDVAFSVANFRLSERTALPSWRFDQHIVTELGDIDRYQNGRRQATPYWTECFLSDILVIFCLLRFEVPPVLAKR
jgi:hypothetical protein